MIRPLSFGFNTQTAPSNAFQQEVKADDVSLNAQKEFDRMVAQLKDAEISVQVFEDLREDLPDSVFSNNWIAHLPDKQLTLFPMLTENRRAEVRADIVDWLIKKEICDTVIDLRASTENQKFLEGTGSIVFDYENNVAYASESPRTDIVLFETYCKQLGYHPVSFQSFDLNGNAIYHTNVMMSVARKYALVCLESITDAVERKMLEIQITQTGRELITISFQQMNHFGGNCIEVLNAQNQPVLLMSQKALNALNADQKKQIQKYATILAFEIPVIETIGGGSVRCMITGLFA